MVYSVSRTEGPTTSLPALSSRKSKRNLVASGQFESDLLKDYAVVGELALDAATRLDPRRGEAVPSTKGVL